MTVSLTTEWATWTEVDVGDEWRQWGDYVSNCGDAPVLTVADGRDAWDTYIRDEFLAEEEMLARECVGPLTVTYRVVVAPVETVTLTRDDCFALEDDITDWVQISASRDEAGVLRVDILTKSREAVTL